MGARNLMSGSLSEPIIAAAEDLAATERVLSGHCWHVESRGLSAGLPLPTSCPTEGMHSVSESQRLFEKDRSSRRTIADAIEVLRQACDFNSQDRAEIRVGPLRLSSGDVVGLVDARFPVRDNVFIVSLPTSSQFSAICHRASQRDCFEIFRLDGRLQGNVVLKDGATLGAVEVIPTRVLFDPTELDWRIVQLAVAMIGAENLCYRSLRAGVPQPQQDMVPGLRRLDCSKLYGSGLPPLKQIAFYIGEQDRTLRKLGHDLADGSA
jgi:hypothetical protein